MPTYFNILRKSLREVLQAGDYRRKHQVGAGVHCQKQEADTFKMCLDEDELTMTIFDGWDWEKRQEGRLIC